ncbi:nitrate- and nitrite sensing domain-containing protein [Primorskyibacter aestuariivivens]|uniref:nitrate- and nitrite sensing domain-containing protein n=1 Tax=Primorskyibacter aestuariivivens TaxID=1888912 RepID=UPI002300B95B|nr:nitrate- and nitrite sensing domain-containing protein [Primorskyibacter aestuariivivens]MDA7430189.1 nitrate- and nitrite sensing domain-containing protein [Primorskyibacter aestuariivivens]
MLVEGGKDDSRQVLKYVASGVLKLVETRNCTNEQLDATLAELAPDFEISMSPSTLKSFGGGIETIRKAVLAKKIDISGDFRKYSLVVSALPDLLQEIASQTPDK